MAIDYLNALNVGSGFDTVAMVDAIVAAEIAPKQNRIDTRRGDVDINISGLATLKSAMQQLQTAFNELNDAREFEFSSLTSTNPDTLYASPNGADTVAGSQTIKVNQLAQGSIRVSDSVADKTADLGAEGQVLSFTVNGTQTSITLNTGDSLEDVVSAINSAGGGATARVVQVDNGNYRLFLQSDQTGLANDVTIDTDLAVLNLNAEANLAQAAADAELTYNGVVVTRSTNIVSDLVPGLTLNLLTAGGSETRLEVVRDDLSAATAITNLVTSFNDFNKIASELLATATESSEGGAFAGDSTIRSLVAQARDLFMSDGSAAGTHIKRMSDMGIAVDRNGVFQIDDAKLASALTDHYDEVKTFFTADTNDQTVFSPATQGVAGDLLVQLNDYLGFNGLVATREASNARETSDLDDAQSILDVKRAALEARYTAQFTTMNRIMSEMNSLKEYLDGQLSNLPFTAKND